MGVGAGVRGAAVGARVGATVGAVVGAEVGPWVETGVPGPGVAVGAGIPLLPTGPPPPVPGAPDNGSSGWGLDPAAIPGPAGPTPPGAGEPAASAGPAAVVDETAASDVPP